MSSLDLTALLTPIPGDNPAGTDIAYEPVIDELKEARRADADYLSQGDWKSDLKVADWPKVKRLTVDILSQRSKDLQVASWLCEAASHLNGFAGAAEGFTLLTGLLDGFWDTLYPAKEDDDLDLRIGRLVWLDTNLPTVLRQLAMTGPTDAGRGYGWARWQESRDVENLRSSQERYKAALEEGKLNAEQWDAAVAKTPAAFYQALQVDSAAALHATQALAMRIDEKFGRDAPSLNGILDTLNKITKLANKLATDKGVAVITVAENEDPLPAESVAAAGAPVIIQDVRSGPPTSRQEALRRLQEIAVYYRESEPQSPVTYLLEKAQRWGNMRLDEWLREVVGDNSTRRELKRELGYSEE